MKRLFLVAALTALAAASATAQVKRTKTAQPGGAEQVLMRIERELARASVKLDPAPYDRYWADDFSGIDAAGGFYTKAEHRAALTGGKLKFDSLDVDEMRVRVFGQAAVLTSRRTVRGRYGEQDISADNRVTSVFIRRAGRWQKIAEHTSRITQR
jgi:ketosteroid isomerase-like protein